MSFLRSRTVLTGKCEDENSALPGGKVIVEIIIILNVSLTQNVFISGNSHGGVRQALDRKGAAGQDRWLTRSGRAPSWGARILL